MTDDNATPSTPEGAAPEGNELPKAYDAKEVEQRWYHRWEEGGVFGADAQATLSGQKKPYVIMMPPPNVTGTLHNGHALFVTLQDVLVRYHRMLGENALWLPGVDHAGIATQAVVERELKRHEGKSRHDLGREAFLERVWDWKEKNGSRIVEQLKTMGASADWSRERFTMDEPCSRAVKHAFVEMWNDGLIYRGQRLVNWDPASHTALSNEEVDYEEREGELWQFAYKVKGADGQPTDQEIVVATTRPETMLGDTAVAVHPDDERYTALHGKPLVHPFFPDRVLTVVADAYVDREFGTGAVKITPAHDPNDFDLGERHGLELINIFNLDATVNDNGGRFSGLDRFEARKQVKEAIAELGLERGATSIKHNVSISQRSGVPIEPLLSRQYFVKARPLAEMASAAIVGSTVELTTPEGQAFAAKLTDDKKTRILPASWLSTWDHFMGNIRDWCISRQLWWGHRIPVFYDLDKLEAAIRDDAAKNPEARAALVALDAGQDRREVLKLALHALGDEAIRGLSVASTDELEKQDPARWVQEDDVLDTWFSSGLWPFSTLGWPDTTDDLKAFYPGAVLETGFDILFFWVARMMMMGTYFLGEVPFHDIFLHAMVRDAHGQKMSKSLGNAIDPLDVINGITKDELLEKTKTYPVPEKNLKKVLNGLAKDYPEGIPASGADGLRFSLAALSGQGRDVKLAIPRVAGYRAFLNKIWNATRFALMRVGEGPVASLDDVKKDLSLGDRWILSRLQAATEKVKKGLDGYRFDEAANAIYQFFWTELCDWYIELVKSSLADDAEEKKREAARSTLVHVLDASMRLLHPICPFQSEEIWQRLPGRAARWKDVGFCAVAPYPAADVGLVDEVAEREIGLVIRAVTMIRNARQESGLPAQKRVPAVVLADDARSRTMLEEMRTELLRLALLQDVTVAARGAYEVPRLSAINAEAGLEVVIPLEGLIDIDAEKERLARELGKAEKDLAGLEKRLHNPSFMDKAPPDVVEQVKSQEADLRHRIERLQAAQQRIAG